jgi:predicted dehydrogenase
LEPPPNEPDLARLLAEHPVDAAFIIMPHAFHHDQTVACLEAGIDGLLEKPMVMNGAEAESLIAVQQRTVKTPSSTGVWQQFQAVRRGDVANPSPPEVGLRMARLYDAIKASAAQGGQPVRLN